MTILKWAFSIVVGGFLLAFGATKFTGGAHIFPYIEYKAATLGLPMADLFFPLVNYAVGVVEILAGVFVLAPPLRRIGAPLAVLPFLGAVGFHLSPLLGVVTPAGYADPAPTEALAAGGGFTADSFSTETTPVLFALAAGMLLLSIVNAVVQRR